ncbi:hypothetical protein AGMMS49950_09710 [Endomicrobiia bacterium]|nr:hypothetical protein AGMMS49950_09710 [Endomicrobiia bacterium]
MDEKLLHPTGPVNDEPAAEAYPIILPVEQPGEEPKHSEAAVQLHPSPPLLGPDVETIVQYDDSHSDTVKKTLKENKLEPKKDDSEESVVLLSSIAKGELPVESGIIISSSLASSSFTDDEGKDVQV